MDCGSDHILINGLTGKAEEKQIKINRREGTRKGKESSDQYGGSGSVSDPALKRT